MKLLTPGVGQVWPTRVRLLQKGNTNRNNLQRIEFKLKFEITNSEVIWYIFQLKYSSKIESDGQIWIFRWIFYINWSAVLIFIWSWKVNNIDNQKIIYHWIYHICWPLSVLSENQAENKPWVLSIWMSSQNLTVIITSSCLI